MFRRLIIRFTTRPPQSLVLPRSSGSQTKHPQGRDVVRETKPTTQEDEPVIVEIQTLNGETIITRRPMTQLEQETL